MTVALFVWACLAYKLYFFSQWTYFSLIPNQPTILSVMAYQLNKIKWKGGLLLGVQWRAASRSRRGICRSRGRSSRSRGQLRSIGYRYISKPNKDCDDGSHFWIQRNLIPLPLALPLVEPNTMYIWFQNENPAPVDQSTRPNYCRYRIAHEPGISLSGSYWKVH